MVAAVAAVLGWRLDPAQSRTVRRRWRWPRPRNFSTQDRARLADIASVPQEPLQRPQVGARVVRPADALIEIAASERELQTALSDARTAEQVLIGGPGGEDVARGAVASMRGVVAPQTSSVALNAARVAARDVCEPAACVRPDLYWVEHIRVRGEGGEPRVDRDQLRPAIAVQVAQAGACLVVAPPVDARDIATGDEAVDARPVAAVRAAPRQQQSDLPLVIAVEVADEQPVHE